MRHATIDDLKIVCDNFRDNCNNCPITDFCISNSNYSGIKNKEKCNAAIVNYVDLKQL